MGGGTMGGAPGRSAEASGRVRAVVFDWAGTVVDSGCQAPVAGLRQAFAGAGVPVTADETRDGMGTDKRRHIRSIGQAPSVSTRWRQVHGAPFRDADADRLYAAFVPAQVRAVEAFADLIPGAAEATARLRAAGLAIGTCTGYPRAVMDALAPLAAAQGFAPDAIICSDEVARARPAPHMLWANLMALGVWPPRRCVKVGDTLSDVGEALAAGTWSVSLALTGNRVGLDTASLDALSEDAREAHRASARKVFMAAGTHLVVDSVADVPAAVATIDRWLAEGRRP